MLHQQAISTKKLATRIGQKMTVLVEEVSDQGYLARSYADAPEIDGVVHITSEQPLAIGEFSQVEITAADEYDLYGSPIK